MPFVKLFDFCQNSCFWAIVLDPVMLESQSRAVQTPITD